MTTLRVATYNIYLGADLTLIFGARDPEHLRAQAQLVLHQLEATWFPERAETVAALLARERVDVVGLQEVARWAKGPIAADGSRGPAVVWCDYLTELLEELERAGTPYDAHAAGSSFSGSAAVTDDEFVSVDGYNVILVRRDGQVTVDAEHTGAFTRTLDIGTGTGERPLTIRRGWGASTRAPATRGSGA